MTDKNKAMERLSDRLNTLADLYKRSIVTGDLLRKQIKSLLSSQDAQTIFVAYIEPDKKAIKILNRLEDPSAWRALFTKNRDQREVIFYDTLESILRSDENQQERILRMLQLVCLPFYSGFLPLNDGNKKVTSEVKPSRVSVLD